MTYIVVQQTSEEGDYYYSHGKFRTVPEEAQVFESQFEAQKVADLMDEHFKTHSHPPELTILKTVVKEHKDC